MNEIWRSVIGWEGLYEVSDQGRVRSLRRDTRTMSPGRKGSGYLYVNLARGGARRTRHVHRLVLEAFVGPCPAGCETRHLDGDPANNRLENLAWGTSAENKQDQRRHGTVVQGEARSCAKLTEEQVYEIRATVGRTKELAERFGVDRRTVRDARRGATWKHLHRIDEHGTDRRVVVLAAPPSIPRSPR